jgi:hypothetical protein
VVCGEEPLQQPNYPDLGWKSVLGPRCRGKRWPGSLAYNIRLRMRFAGLRENERGGMGSPADEWTRPTLADVFLGGPPDIEATEENIRHVRGRKAVRE